MTWLAAGDWLTTDEAAKLLKVSRRRVQALIKAGRIRATAFGRDWLLLRPDVEAFEPLPPGRPAKSQEAKPTARKRAKS